MDEGLDALPRHRPDDPPYLGRGSLGPVEVDHAPHHEVGHRVERRLFEDEVALDPLVQPGALGLLAVDEERVLVEDAGLLAGR